MRAWILDTNGIESELDKKDIKDTIAGMTRLSIINRNRTKCYVFGKQNPGDEHNLAASQLTMKFVTGKAVILEA